MTFSRWRAMPKYSAITAWLLCTALAAAQPKPAPQKPTTSANKPAPQPAPSPTQSTAAPAPTSGEQPSAAAPATSEETAPTKNEGYADADPRALTDFKPYLDPHGAWVQDPTYGLVWIPNAKEVGEDFSPYVTDGHWTLNEEGDWIWVSDYPFGWIVFHYGRWVWSDTYGWVWIAGRQYAPAWVVWRVPTGSYAYVGWAPAPPGYVWWDGFAVSLWWYMPPVAYVFVPSYYVFSPYVHRYVVVDAYRVRAVARYTTPYRVPATARPRGPSTQSARVPAEAVPQQRTAADARALSWARRDTAVPYSVPPIRRAPMNAASTHGTLPSGALQRRAASPEVAPMRSPVVGYDRSPVMRTPVSRPEMRMYTVPQANPRSPPSRTRR